jgi:hypothetical protein
VQVQAALCRATYSFISSESTCDVKPKQEGRDRDVPEARCYISVRGHASAPDGSVGHGALLKT